MVVPPYSQASFGASAFDRHDPFKEAQELLSAGHSRFPKRSVPAGVWGRPDVGCRTVRLSETAIQDGCAAESEKVAVADSEPALTCRSVEAAATRALQSRLKRSDRSVRGVRSRPPPVTASHSVRAWAALQRMPEHQVDLPSYQRRNVLQQEILDAQRRWPAEARWAGHLPNFVKERHDRLGTFTKERGDGRSPLASPRSGLAIS
eukprot:CAMPEP_0206420480 /NCGR_PEP_ID=MMETSP0324_2-20121206/867_1 /ASSEMBLY_ACC=CAM_ASM_000836 /TAXON_ID=2866 /ORGANISM="Crypthecodinium cohnii, Strain Seligo" /LENGTH=204 /DNA_ID=CAMNT_0053884371 /DNA_START=40 /DNA_END=654 /DNA_ORIENTATION=+